MAYERNAQMVRQLLAEGYLDERTARAFLAAPRELFVPSELSESAYSDHPLPIGHGQTISAPGVVAIMSRALEVKEGMRILEIGTGSGYQTAILARLVGKTGHVHSIERLKKISGLAAKNLSLLPDLRKSVSLYVADGHLGLPEFAPFDRIIVTAAAQSMPPALASQLAPDGKMIIPINAMFGQDLILYDKRTGAKTNLLPVIFVPLVRGEE